MKIIPNEKAREKTEHPSCAPIMRRARKRFIRRFPTFRVSPGWKKESDALLLEFYAHQTAEEITYSHKWSANMLVMWDNARFCMPRQEALMATTDCCTAQRLPTRGSNASFIQPRRHARILGLGVCARPWAQIFRPATLGHKLPIGRVSCVCESFGIGTLSGLHTACTDLAQMLIGLPSRGARFLRHFARDNPGILHRHGRALRHER